MIEKLLEVYGHLGASLVQSIDSDDQIIMGHVRDAHFIVQSAIKDARKLEDEKKALQDKLAAIKNLDRHNPKFFPTLNVDVNWVVSNEDLEKILEG